MKPCLLEENIVHCGGLEGLGSKPTLQKSEVPAWKVREFLGSWSKNSNIKTLRGDIDIQSLPTGPTRLDTTLSESAFSGPNRVKIRSKSGPGGGGVRRGSGPEG